MLTVKIPDPEYVSGKSEIEIYGKTIKEVHTNLLHLCLIETGYSPSEIGSRYNVYEDGECIGVLTWNGKFEEGSEV